MPKNSMLKAAQSRARTLSRVKGQLGFEPNNKKKEVKEVYFEKDKTEPPLNQPKVTTLLWLAQTSFFPLDGPPFLP